jgi:hypothetical protein
MLPGPLRISRMLTLYILTGAFLSSRAFIEDKLVDNLIWSLMERKEVDALLKKEGSFSRDIISVIFLDSCSKDSYSYGVRRRISYFYYFFFDLLCMYILVLFLMLMKIMWFIVDFLGFEAISLVFVNARQVFVHQILYIVQIAWKILLLQDPDSDLQIDNIGKELTTTLQWP